MTEPKIAAKFAQVVQKIAPQSKLLRTWVLPGGISAQLTALAVLLPTGQIQKMVVRQPGARAIQHNPQAAADEFKLLQAMQSAGVTTPAPYLLDQSGEIFAAPYIVMEYMEGQPDFAPAQIDDCVRQIATQLAKIHRVDLSMLDLPFLPQQTVTSAQAFKARPATLDESLDEGQIRAILEAAWPLPPLNQPALLHGDFWPGNLLWQAGQLVAVVDWEDAAVGNPLTDFAISRLDILWIFGRDAMHEFTRHYQAVATLDFTQLPYWDLSAALRPAGRIAEWAAGWPVLGRSDITEQTMRAGHGWFITQAFAQLA